MITFKKGTYTSDELKRLCKALELAQTSFTCSSLGCELCPNSKPCLDISLCKQYVSQLVNQNQ